MECGCGRSPTGQCIGWHKLSEEEYQEKLKEHEDKDNEDCLLIQNPPWMIWLMSMGFLINAECES